jgi:iron complex transport system substrate-binding protein
MRLRVSPCVRPIAATVAAMALLSTAACSGDAPAAEGGDFSATVPAAYGDVQVTEKPERVVALTVQAAEILVELGIQPVAVATTEEEIGEMYPWLEGVFTGALDPDLTPAYVADPEAIGAHDPDLIVGTTWNIAEDVYAQLTDVAPTFPGLAAANDDWNEVAAALGELTGTDGQALVDEVESACATAREGLTSLQDKTYQYVAAEEGQFRFGNGSWLECFGLKPAENQDNTQSTDAAVSEERLDQLDADVLAIFDRIGAEQTVQDDPRFAELPASAPTGAVLWMDVPLANATNSPGPLSYPYFIAQVLPELESAAAGRG